MATVLTMLARVTWLLQVALGIVFWTGRASGTAPLHILIGLVFVLTLWALAVLALRSETSVAFSLMALVWGLVILLFGLAQTMLLVGNAHWIIQILHLLFGIVAIALVEVVAKGLRRPA
jgi:hypothetical protein